ncbi:hypothetical protein B0H12DRAFT_313637 [Mycena haematopus]|nr:hypothetical protein B0H12DRAFT_313637 [Mycena haematopus]
MAQRHFMERRLEHVIAEVNLWNLPFPKTLVRLGCLRPLSLQLTPLATCDNNCARHVDIAGMFEPKPHAHHTPPPPSARRRYNETTIEIEVSQLFHPSTHLTVAFSSTPRLMPHDLTSPHVQELVAPHPPSTWQVCFDFISISQTDFTSLDISYSSSFYSPFLLTDSSRDSARGLPSISLASSIYYVISSLL